MPTPDLNLLIKLDALLCEQSINKAAERLGQSPSATRRDLSQLRRQLNDPLLVRNGRQFCPTPRAQALQPYLTELLLQAQQLLQATPSFDPATAQHTFTLITAEGFVETFGARLIAYLQQQAPLVQLRFGGKTHDPLSALRQGEADLAIDSGQRQPTAELQKQALFSEPFVGVVRATHPLLSTKITPASYTEGQHVSTWQTHPIDQALQTLGLRRQIATTVDSYLAALTLCASTDLIATVPERCTQTLRLGLHSFALPFRCPELQTQLLWHPRVAAEPAQHWLRQCVQQVCAPRAPSAHELSELERNTGSGFRTLIYEK